MAHPHFKILFTDVGGVIATNGWDTELRRNMVNHFGLDHESVATRHRLMFDSYERGHLSLDQYLQWTVFFEPRPFRIEDVKLWMFEQGKLLPGAYDMFGRVKTRHGLKIALISNEGAGLTEDRVRRFRLGELADYMIFSHAVRLRKPDPQIWELALALAQARAPECLYIDDRLIFAEFAASLGFKAYQHTSVEKTAAFLAGLGLASE
jgi:putative hydrolase of the HAD superfamily